MRKLAVVLLAFTALLFAQSGEVVPRITHGPMLGRIGADHVGVWARTARPAAFRVFYGTDPNQLDQVSEPGETHLSDDNTGWLMIEGLEPDTKYYYEATTRNRPGGLVHRSGSFHTLNSPEAARDAETNPDGLFNFRFEFATGNNQNGRPSLPAFQTMNSELLREDTKHKVDFAILNGDWLYEDDRDYPVDAWRGQVGIDAPQTPREVSLMPYVVGVWENYKTYLARGLPLANWHRNVPSYYTYDDHEVLNDIYRMGEVGVVERKPVFRDTALTAWYDYLAWSNEVPPTQPILFGEATFEAGSDVIKSREPNFSNIKLEESATLHVHWGENAGELWGTVSETEGGDPNAGVYEIVEVLDDNRVRINPPAKANGTQTYSVGRRSYFKKRVSNVDIFFLDTRSFREQHDMADVRNPGRSMIGEQQRQWLMDEMRASDATFTFVVSPVNFTIPHTAPPTAGGMADEGKDEAWTVFIEERDQLINLWDELGKPVFVITGDLHNSFVIKVSDNVWEFAGGPHNSAQHPLSSEGDRPPNGLYGYEGREVEIRWSSFARPDTPNRFRNRVIYCVAQINNVWEGPGPDGDPRWVAYPKPQMVVQYYDGVTGDLLYAESILATK